MATDDLVRPCTPPGYEDDLQCYSLAYEGLCLLFPIPAEFREEYQSKKRDLTKDLVLPDGKPPRISRILLFTGV